jgi:hypothetical protein
MRCPDVSGGVTPSGLTVNQPSYDFEGSSPSSPTILRSLRRLRLGRPWRSDGCPVEDRAAKTGCRAVAIAKLSRARHES